MKKKGKCGKMLELVEQSLLDNDPLGYCLFDWDNGVRDGMIEVYSPSFEVDHISASYLFRNYNNMPEIEKIALSHCRGKILDVGCGSGCHLEYLHKKGFDIEGIDLSTYAINRLVKKGFKANRENFFSKEGNYDSILFLMNGLGVAGTINGVSQLLEQGKKLLNKGGQLLFDSSDLCYLYDLPKNKSRHRRGKFRGEIDYKMKYKDVEGKEFKWLFLDHFNLREICKKSGYKVEILYEDNQFAYLAMLSLE